jgi:ABC-2 type transport system ATP-binding protein
VSTPLKIINLNKNYSGVSILRNINIEIKNGEIFGLIALNGAGKTTLIKIILNLLKSDGGEIFITDIKNTEPKSRNELKYLPEKFQISSPLTGIEFLKIFNKNLNKDEIIYLSKLLMFDKYYLQKRISKYSKGMVQKLGLISTFLDDSKIIILDEPMSGLDSIARISLKKIMLLNKQKNKSIFFSSHILSDIDEICDRIAILNNTNISFLGTPEEFKRKHNESLLEKAFLKEIAK